MVPAFISVAGRMHAHTHTYTCVHTCVHVSTHSALATKTKGYIILYKMI